MVFAYLIWMGPSYCINWHSHILGLSLISIHQWSKILFNTAQVKHRIWKTKVLKITLVLHPNLTYLCCAKRCTTSHIALLSGEYCNWCHQIAIQEIANYSCVLLSIDSPFCIPVLLLRYTSFSFSSSAVHMLFSLFKRITAPPPSLPELI